jgi:hypothetical protein
MTSIACCQEYEHILTWRRFKMHVYSGNSSDVFGISPCPSGRKLTVFFYRGDSDEGGSGFYW